LAKLDGAQLDALQNDYDKRLEEEVKKIRRNYREGDSQQWLKREAKECAREAREEVLNLCCPHCKAVYGEFTECLALKCSTCKKYFCGWCHKGFEDSRATHQHVKDCPLSQSERNYFASPKEISRGQALFRRNSLKRFLGKKKKELRNAIVIELAADLHQLGLDPNGFFFVDNFVP